MAGVRIEVQLDQSIKYVDILRRRGMISSLSQVKMMPKTGGGKFRESVRFTGGAHKR